MNLLKFSLLIAVASASAYVSAANNTPNTHAIKWDAVGVGVSWSKFDLALQEYTVDTDMRGYRLYGTKVIFDDVFVYGGLDKSSETVTGLGSKLWVDSNRMDYGLGYAYRFDPYTSVYVKVGGLSEEIESRTLFISRIEDVSAVTFSLGVRGTVSDQLEFFAEATQHAYDFDSYPSDNKADYTDLKLYHSEKNFADGVQFNVGLRHHFNQDFALAAHFRTLAEGANYGVAMEYYF